MVKCLVERAAAEQRPGRGSQVGKPSRGCSRGGLDQVLGRAQPSSGPDADGVRADRGVEVVPGAGELSERFKNVYVRAGDVACDRVDGRQHSFPAPPVDGVGHIEPLAAQVESGHQLGGDEVTDVGDHPVGARFDGLIGPQGIDAAPHHRDLDSDPVEQFAQRPRNIGADRILLPVILGQRLPQACLVIAVIAVGDGAHRVTTPMVSSVCGRLK